MTNIGNKYQCNCTFVAREGRYDRCRHHREELRNAIINGLLSRQPWAAEDLVNRANELLGVLDV